MKLTEQALPENSQSSSTLRAAVQRIKKERKNIVGRLFEMPLEPLKRNFGGYRDAYRDAWGDGGNWDEHWGEHYYYD